MWMRCFVNVINCNAAINIADKTSTVALLQLLHEPKTKWRRMSLHIIQYCNLWKDDQWNCCVAWRLQVSARREELHFGNQCLRHWTQWQKRKRKLRSFLEWTSTSSLRSRRPWRESLRQSMRILFRLFALLMHRLVYSYWICFTQVSDIGFFTCW